MMSIQEDLESVRRKIGLLNELNKSLVVKSGNVLNIFNNEKILNITNFMDAERTCKENTFFCMEEVKRVNECFRKCVELLQKCSKEKQRKKLEEKTIVSGFHYGKDNLKSIEVHDINDSGQLLQKSFKKKQRKKIPKSVSRFHDESDNVKSFEREVNNNSKKLACYFYSQNMNSISNTVKASKLLSPTNFSKKEMYMSPDVLQDKLSHPFKNNADHNNKSDSERSRVENVNNDIIYLETVSCRNKENRINPFKRNISKNLNKSEVNNDKEYKNDHCTQNMHQDSDVSFSTVLEVNNTVKNPCTLHCNGGIELEKEKHKQIFQKYPVMKNSDIVCIDLSDTSKMDVEMFVSKKSRNTTKKNPFLHFKKNQFSLNENNHSLLSCEKFDSTISHQEIKLCDYTPAEDVSFIAEVKNFSRDAEIKKDGKETIIQEWDFTEEPVNFTVPFIHSSEKTTHFSKEEINSLISKDISVKKGKWSKQEEALLKRNFNNFKCQFGISDPRLLLGIGRRNTSDKLEKMNVKRFLKAKHFYVRLGKDLNNRLLYYVYQKARYLFDPLRVENKCDKDLSVLFQLQKKYGNSWELIARKFGRPSSYCRDTYYKHKHQLSKGKWSKEEEEKLYNAVKNMKATLNLLPQSSEGISWEKIAKQVGSRNYLQCYIKWNHNMTVGSHLKYPKWSWRYNLKLLNLLNEKYFVNDQANVDWKEIFKNFKNIVPSVSYLRLKYRKLKLYAPKEIRTRHPDVIDFLLKKALTKIANQL